MAPSRTDRTPLERAGLSGPGRSPPRPKCPAGQARPQTQATGEMSMVSPEFMPADFRLIRLSGQTTLSADTWDESSIRIEKY